ncbi:MAG TPA: succinate--CoA ligase subunit alpha, partial [Alphaproteobacteria bacterium]
EAAEFIRDHMTKPVIAYVAGLTAPRGRRMGHAGAIISAFGESADEKVEILQEAGVTIAPSPSALGEAVALRLARAA